MQLKRSVNADISEKCFVPLLYWTMHSYLMFLEKSSTWLPVHLTQKQKKKCIPSSAAQHESWNKEHGLKDLPERALWPLRCIRGQPGCPWCFNAGELRDSQQPKNTHRPCRQTDPRVVITAVYSCQPCWKYPSNQLRLLHPPYYPAPWC